MKRSFTAVFLFFICWIALYSQNKIRVVDGETNRPMTDVNVTLRKKGTITDKNGYFDL